MIFILFLLGAWASNAYAQGQLQVEAPFIPVACLSSFINFSGGQSPYSLSILDAGTRNTLGSFTVTQSPYLWSIPNAAGRQLLFRIEDATGANAESGNISMLYLVLGNSNLIADQEKPLQRRAP
ncbi:hypothetical protein FRC17_008527 [Serendipita sp. 399]|nr:hypothetical protein FRC17_008527 [Serendipita sp. 399]